MFKTGVQDGVVLGGRLSSRQESLFLVSYEDNTCASFSKIIIQFSIDFVILLFVDGILDNCHFSIRLSI